MGNIDVSRDFSDVRQIVLSIAKLIDIPTSKGNTYNLCSGVATSLSDVIKLCAEITSREIKTIINPSFVRKNEIKLLAGDNSNLKSIIGDYTPTAMIDLLKWMLYK